MLDRDEIAMQRVIDFMHENLGEPITVADLARVASFSKFHFSRVFQRSTFSVYAAARAHARWTWRISVLVG